MMSSKGMTRLGSVLGRALMRPKNLAAGVAAAAGGIICAQTAYLQITYRPLGPPTDNSYQGVERWSIDSPHREMPRWVENLMRRISRSSEKTSMPEPENVQPVDSERQKQTNTKRVLIIGDSLVVGIGCKKCAVLPQAICKQLAQLLHVDVEWRALGVDGGDVRTIHKQVLQVVDDMQLNHVNVSRQKQFALSMPLTTSYIHEKYVIPPGYACLPFSPDGNSHKHVPTQANAHEADGAVQSMAHIDANTTAQIPPNRPGEKSKV
jgi:hypothetical protein